MRSPQEIWETALGELQVQVTRPNFDTWLKDTVGISYQDDLFVIGAPNAFVAEWLENRLLSLVKKTLASVTGRKVHVQFFIQTPHESDMQPAYACQADGGTSVKLSRPVKSTRLNPKYIFDTFIAGESNRLAYAASLEVAENPGNVYNPLFIYGDTGLGKTHLLHAIGNAAKAGGNRILYVSAEQLTNEFVIALKNNTTEEFHQKYRSVDVLLVDDFQFLSGKNQTQECFFHIFNDLHDNNCQIAITCDSPPKAICAIGKKLKSRLEWGLVADIKPPESETRLTILSAKAKQLRTSVPPDVLQLLATQFRHNVRELEGSLNRVSTYAKLSGVSIDMNLAEQALALLMPKDNQQSTTPTPKLVIDTVASYYALTPEALTGKRRDRKTSLARQVAMYLIREQNHYHLSKIGDIFGGRDHTTVLHGCEKISNESKVNPDLGKSIEQIRQELGIHKKP